ncbi:MAG: hypothetical protein KAT68_15215 [Bacteroidales bacterium]|nr:hypothetical protein [Bacteroidales bacterium]
MKTIQLVKRNSIIFSIFFMLNVLMVFTERFFQENTSEIIGLILAVSLFLVLVAININSLKNYNKIYIKYGMSALISIVVFIITWIIVYFFNWYVLYPVINN